MPKRLELEPPEDWGKPPKGLLDAAVPPEVCAVVPKFPKRLFEFVAFPDCGLLRLNIDPGAALVPALIGGGGPAGVVEPNANPVLALFAGVAFACPDAAVEPTFPNGPALPLLAAAPKIPGPWPAPEVSVGLFGVEKPVNPEDEPVFGLLLVDPMPNYSGLTYRCHRTSYHHH